MLEKPTDPWRFLLRGRFVAGQVHLRRVASRFAPSPQQIAEVESHWQAAHRPGIHLFDGPMCRLEALRHAHGQLHLDWSPTSYRWFIGTNRAAALTGRGLRHQALPPRARANPLGLSALLRCGDGRLLLGRRSMAVAYHPGRIHPFAGTLEPDDPPDPFTQMLRELDEELAVGGDEISSIALIAIAEDRALAQPELIFEVLCRRSSAELCRRLDVLEHTHAVAVEERAEAIAQALADADCTPIAQAALSAALAER